jgi:glycosyltransferase involved in cell wall biosynthesis
MAQVLLTVSGVIDSAVRDKIARGARPRADYLELARAFDAELLDYAAARRQAGFVGRLLERAGGPNLLLAWHCFRRRGEYRAIFTDGEQVGIPLAILLKFCGRGRSAVRHLMIGHVLSVGKKVLLFDLLGIKSAVDRFFVYATCQQRFVESRLSVPAAKVGLIPFMVDSEFFALERLPNREGGETSADRKPTICAVGLEYRDYPTLVEAVRGLDVQLVIAAASPWSKRADTTPRQALPENVVVRQYSQYELRQLYAASRFVVVPLSEVDFQAGVTTILEAMAMERAVICSRTRGQTDVVVEGETGRYVPVGDPVALRAAIEELLANPEEARRMGQAGRRRVQQELSLDRYVERLDRSLRAVLADGKRDGWPERATTSTN